MIRIAAIFSLILVCFTAKAQPQTKVIDQVIGVVGRHIVLQSELESQYLQYLAQGSDPSDDTRCQIIEQMLLERLLLNQAEVDSVEVSDGQVEAELDKRMRYFTQQLGSEQKLEEYLGKSIIQIKADYKDDVRNMLLSQTMQGKITSGITVTPGDVRAYFNSIPQDSLPLINAEVEIAQIVKMPPISQEEKKNVKEKLNKIRERIVNGEDFATLAVLYSEDGSARDGGELGFRGREELVTEFASVAFELKGSEVSKIVESQFGYHIIQLIERRGELINVRHILMSPKNTSTDLLKSQQFLDSIHNILKSDTISFEKAAQKFSDDVETKYNGGLIVNPQTGTTRFETSELDPTTFFTIDKLKPGEFSGPVKFQTKDGKTAFRILYLKLRTEPHRANLKEDYQQIQNAALMQKQGKALGDWVKKKKSTTYIKLDEEFKSCGFQYQWVN